MIRIKPSTSNNRNPISLWKMSGKAHMFSALFCPANEQGRLETHKQKINFAQHAISFVPSFHIHLPSFLPSTSIFLPSFHLSFLSFFLLSFSFLPFPFSFFSFPPPHLLLILSSSSSSFFFSFIHHLLLFHPSLLWNRVVVPLPWALVSPRAPLKHLAPPLASAICLAMSSTARLMKASMSHSLLEITFSGFEQSFIFFIFLFLFLFFFFFFFFFPLLSTRTPSSSSSLSCLLNSSSSQFNFIQWRVCVC